MSLQYYQPSSMCPCSTRHSYDGPQGKGLSPASVIRCMTRLYPW